MKSLVHNKDYPIMESTKMLKIYFNKYIFTIISDINTDERHYINLKFYGSSLENCYGGLIEQEKLLVLDNLIEVTGTEKEYYNNN
jgi:hypothetical protein